MKNSVKQELKSYLLDLINDEALSNDNVEDWHFYAFNEDYYIIGYYEASKWLERHELNTFDTIAYVRDYEIDNFGSFTTDVNSEAIVNMYVYILGEELLSEYDVETVEELKEELEK